MDLGIIISEVPQSIEQLSHTVFQCSLWGWVDTSDGAITKNLGDRALG